MSTQDFMKILELVQKFLWAQTEESPDGLTDMIN
jgi:hypothetical protein